MRRLAVVLLLVMLCVSLGAQKKKKTAVPAVAPDAVPHSIAQFLRTMSKDGSRSVTFKATAVGTRFYFEETAGVTVYRFERGNYVREEFLRGSTLAKAVRKYSR